MLIPLIIGIPYLQFSLWTDDLVGFWWLNKSLICSSMSWATPISQENNSGNAAKPCDPFLINK